jgi:hypothetical protein
VAVAHLKRRPGYWAQRRFPEPVSRPVHVVPAALLARWPQWDPVVSDGVQLRSTGTSASRIASVSSKGVSPTFQSLLGRSVFHGSSAGCGVSDSTGGASPTIQPLLRRSVRQGSSCSPRVTTQASCMILMPDSYSDCKKLAAPSRQHLRGAHVTQHWEQVRRHDGALR